MKREQEQPPDDGFLRRSFLDDLKKTKLFFKTTKKKSFQPNSFDHQLSGWEEYFPLWCTDRNCLPAAPSLPPNPIKSCIVFISEICYFRMTEIFSQLRRGAEICKYVFGSVTVTMFSWCFFSEFEIVYYHFGRKKKEKNLYVNLSKYSKENKLAIKLSFLYTLF